MKNNSTLFPVFRPLAITIIYSITLDNITFTCVSVWLYLFFHCCCTFLDNASRSLDTFNVSIICDIAWINKRSTSIGKTKNKNRWHCVQYFYFSSGFLDGFVEEYAGMHCISSWKWASAAPTLRFISISKNALIWESTSWL